jgi:hypothetical protein
MKKVENITESNGLFKDKIELIKVDSVIGSGYEADVAKLALIDKIAYRAARKNMQIHSAIILKINDEFSGFFTFQINHEAKEFCLLQSAMYPDRKDKAIYSRMIQAIIDNNTAGYPMVMTVSAKHYQGYYEVSDAVYPHGDIGRPVRRLGAYFENHAAVNRLVFSVRIHGRLQKTELFGLVVYLESKEPAEFIIYF